MYDVSRTGLRLAGLLLMAVCVAHCGDNNVHIQTGNGTNPSPGTFVGATDQGGALTIQVGSIEAIAFDCDGVPVSQTFSPPKQVNPDGTFDVQFSMGGRHFDVSGRFSSNDDVAGIIDDENNQCDTGFQASREGAPTTATPDGRTATPTPGTQETETPTPEVTATPAETATGETPTPTGETVTPTTAGVTATPTPGPSGSCPTLITFTGTSTNGVLDTGWTGQGHDATVISNGTVTVQVGSCAGTAPHCGVCTFTGPVANAAGQLQSQRCSNDSSKPCTSDANCTGGTCKFFFGSYLPLAAGGVSTCVENTFNGTISGTANIDTGSSASSAKLTSRVFNGITLANPCPLCGTGAVGSTGTCSGGANSGKACTVSGVSPNVAFGSTSLDCPPASGALIATLPIDLSNTTGAKTRTLSASNPNCRALGFTSLKCQCDTCGDAAAEPCASNADCPGGAVCGGKRCTGGANNGHACTANTECPGGACGVPGTATQPNQCGDGVCTVPVKQCIGGANDNGVCTASSACPGGTCGGPGANNEGSCEAGPFEQFCGPVETFRGCTSNADCTRPSDTCSVGRFRDCFDSGNVGDTVTATGQGVAPVNHQSDPTLAALFCIGPTSGGSVNNAAGLPGLGRLEIRGHATDNGTP